MKQLDFVEQCQVGKPQRAASQLDALRSWCRDEGTRRVKDAARNLRGARARAWLEGQVVSHLIPAWRLPCVLLPQVEGQRCPVARPGQTPRGGWTDVGMEHV